MSGGKGGVIFIGEKRGHQAGGQVEKFEKRSFVEGVHERGDTSLTECSTRGGQNKEIKRGRRQTGGGREYLNFDTISWGGRERGSGEGRVLMGVVSFRRFLEGGKELLLWAQKTDVEDTILGGCLFSDGKVTE